MSGAPKALTDRPCPRKVFVPEQTSTIHYVDSRSRKPCPQI